MGADVVCAVDIGTSSVRAALVAPSGEVLVERRCERHGAESQFEAAVLWQEVVAVLAGVTAAAAELPGAPRAVGVGVTGHVGTVVLDRQDRPLLPAGGWSDRRGVSELHARWRDDPHLLARTGRSAVAGGAVAVLCDLDRRMPEGMASLGTVFAPKDYVNLMLTGVHATDPTSAAYTLALDVRRRRWDEELLAVTRAGRWVLPDLAGATDVVGRVLPEAARTTGLPAGIPVATGGPDGTVGAAAILGTDTDCIGDIAGTTDVVVRVVPAPDPAPAGVVVNPYLADGLWSQGGPTGMTGGGATYWLQMLGQDPAELLLEALTTVGPGSDGLRALPHLTGSRFPVWQPEERGWLAGLSPRHRPGHIVRAVHEGAAFAVREALDILDPGSMAPVLLAGGVAKSEGLIRLRADVTGRRTLTRTAPDASLLGAARIAQLAIGIHDSWPAAVASGPPVGSPVEPAVAAVKTYQEEYDDWRTLRSAIAPRE